MNFTTFPRIAQVPAALPVLALIACSQGGSSSPVPANPEATVISFLSAVRAQNMNDMAALWGSSAGPAADRLDSQTLEQRLTVMRIYLEHEEYTIVPRPSDVIVELEAGEQAVFVRLVRKGCTPVVPFILAPYRGGWLVRNIDLERAGNPARRCQP
ncbi:MAG: hypothetical protein AMS21_12995 [Gemmatimonas sp. SG8_38_2]|nr:MAG: hypothetical protein AMS21_12995 [Gemmatimonas sp. SG8_38_2]